MVSDKMLPCLKSNPNPAFLAVPADVSSGRPLTSESVRGVKGTPQATAAARVTAAA